MSKSKQEELLASLWCIATALLLIVGTTAAIIMSVVTGVLCGLSMAGACIESYKARLQKEATDEQ